MASKKVYNFKIDPIEDEIFDTTTPKMVVFDGLHKVEWQLRIDFYDNDNTDKDSSHIKRIIISPICRIASFVEAVYEPHYSVSVSVQFPGMNIVQEFTKLTYDPEDRVYRPAYETISWEKAYSTFYHRKLYKLTELDCEFTVIDTKPTAMLLNLERTMENYRSIYESAERSDITLRLLDGEIPAHKFILTAHSPVFERMFSIDMVERSSNVVVIEDIDKATMDALLRYIYYNDIEGMVESPTKAYVAADKYQIETAMEIAQKLEARSGIIKD